MTMLGCSLRRKAAAAAAVLAAAFASHAAAADEQLPPRIQDPPAPPGRTVCTRSAEDPAFARLCGWLEDECHATDTQNVYIADFEHGGVPVRGLGVVQDVRRGDYVFCVPEKCWINDKTLERSLGEVTHVEGALCEGYERVALFIAEEKLRGSESFFNPYFSSLPPEEVYRRFHPAYLEGYDLHPSIDYWKTWLTGLEKCHAGRRIPTMSQLKLAYIQLLTRQYESAGMTPLLDMPNTGPDEDVNVAQELNDRGDFCLKAKWDITAGTELLVDYGASSHSPMLMLILYGFALPGEAHNTTAPSPEEYEESEYMLSPPDDCAGLRPTDFKLPPDPNPVLLNYARFAKRFCSEEKTGSSDTTTPLPRTDL